MSHLKNYIKVSLVLLHVVISNVAFAQLADSIKAEKKESFAIKKHNPKLATKRSLILPGWGQAYNKEYWKIPIVYGALSIPTITFFYNNTVYKESKYAYEARILAQQVGATAADSIPYYSLDTKYQRADIGAIQTLRNSARRDRDYSVLWFLVVWGLNVADATVFGHLKDFDVSNNLTLNVKPNFNPITKTPGIGLTFKLKNKKSINLVTTAR